MISWKDSFEKLNEEYEMTKKKKQALDDLLNAGRISQPTYDSFNKKIDEAVVEIEKQQKMLLDKMNVKAEELEQHIKTLETLLANYEIRHVAGEIEEEIYEREISLLSTGLDTARNELNTMKEATNELSQSIRIPTIEPTPLQGVITEPTETLETEPTETLETEPTETLETEPTETLETEPT
ncbi:MAG: CdvA-like protein, partial [Candidatus Bathyarchaeota archaeon]